jgi:hypothetical protein
VIFFLEIPIFPEVSRLQSSIPQYAVAGFVGREVTHKSSSLVFSRQVRESKQSCWTIREMPFNQVSGFDCAQPTVIWVLLI